MPNIIRKISYFLLALNLLGGKCSMEWRESKWKPKDDEAFKKPDYCRLDGGSESTLVS